MMRTITLVAGLLLASMAPAWSAPPPPSVLPEATGVMERYDSARQVLYVDGREYRLVGRAAQDMADFVARHGATALSGKHIAFGGGRDEHGRPYIDNLIF